MLSEWVIATSKDESGILALMRSFYEEERLEFHTETAIALRSLLADPSLGILFTLPHEGKLNGYMIATVGFSVEFGGRFVLLDEVFLLPDFRGRGCWKTGLSCLERWAASIGASAIRLEVNHHNRNAAAIYDKAGFGNDERDLMTKWLAI